MAQKKTIKQSSVNDWPTIEQEKISNNGKYVCCKISTKNNGSDLLVKSIDSSWGIEIHGANDVLFTEDSKHLIYITKKGDLGVFDLSQKDTKYIKQVRSFKVAENGTGEWLAYMLSDLKQVVLLNLFTGTEQTFLNVSNYFFNEQGTVLVTQSTDSTKNNSNNILLWHNLKERKSVTISRNCEMYNYTFDKTGLKFAFVEKKRRANNHLTAVLSYYKQGMDSAIVEVDESTLGMTGMEVCSDGNFMNLVGLNSINSLLPHFSENGEKILFSIKKFDSGEDDNVENVLIWSYKDRSLISSKNRNQLMKKKDVFLAIVDLLSNGHIIKLDSEEDLNTLVGCGNIDYVIVTKEHHRNEFDIPSLGFQDIYLVNTKDGSRKLLREKLYQPMIGMSLTEKYILWFDMRLKQYFSYNILDQTIRNITQKIPTPLCNDENIPDSSSPIGIVGWLQGEREILLYDRYDVWKVDLEGKESPLNLTNSYGLKNHTILRCMNVDGNVPIQFTDTLILTGFNTISKKSMFSKLIVHPQKMTVFQNTSLIYYFPSRYSFNLSDLAMPFAPVRAKYCNTYIVKGMNVNKFPNLYLTTNFIDFKPITSLAPQNSYNWITSELLHWKMFDGKQGEGILYKPENFNPNRQYPIIFYFYERNSDALNFFLNPELSRGTINIPTFVSNDYLVFVPNIYYKIGFPGESAYNSIVSAAEFLAQQKWVNNKKMGLQGHSFGGFVTNYIITRTKIFSAAASAAGVSNLTSLYGDLMDGDAKESYFEKRQGRIGASLWKSQSLYIKNSPIFKADKVTTPLLIMHNLLDQSVSWSQAVEWFTGLRRLGKKVWLIQYTGEGHVLFDDKNMLDYSIRLEDFFDFYLKDKDAANWMLK
jgi:dipeptidyl aminopeptidase/acylaminoacyl peptidase